MDVSNIIRGSLAIFVALQLEAAIMSAGNLPEYLKYQGEESIT
jgi:hypothetical protein